jgi:hypothetical protein
MKKIVALALCFGGLYGCSSTALAPDAAREQVKQLMVLFQENKPKFVLQKQELEQASDCGRATSLREAIDALVTEQALSPEKNETLTMVQMELSQAEKTCTSR